MNSNKPETLTDSLIERRLEDLKDVPERDPLQAASGRTRFLREADGYRQAVSPGKRVRQNGWIFQIRKEKLAMNALVSLILAASFLLGGGATVAAAQDDLPTQSLYQLKLWTETAKLAMTGDPQEQADLLMTMAQTRVQELATLVESGATPPDQVRDRLEEHLRQIIRLADGMDEPTREQTLLQLRDRLQTQDRIMEQLQIHASAETEPMLARTRQMLQLHLHLVDQGLAETQRFRYMLENQMQYGQDESATPEPNQQGDPGFHQNGPNEQPGDGPGAENGNSERNGSPDGPDTDSPPDGNSDNTGNDSSGGPNPDNQQGGGDGFGNDATGGPNPDSPQSGDGPGEDNGNGNGSGGGGGNN